MAFTITLRTALKTKWQKKTAIFSIQHSANIRQRVEGGFGVLIPQTHSPPMLFLSSQFLPLFTQSRKFGGLCVHAQSFPVMLTLCDPMNHGNTRLHKVIRFQARLLELVPCPPQGSSQPRIQTSSPTTPALQANLHHLSHQEAFQEELY